tara:strand:+ start:313 stop:1236 length:924 start_codon:yes stop_codon:yes gene_type:complete
MTISENEAVTKILHSHLGKSTPHKNGEKSFHCPFCNHHKKKLEVNILTQKWHCWICNTRGARISTLLRKTQAPKYLIQEANDVYGDFNPNNIKKEYKKLTALPSEYKPLYLQTRSPHYKNALHYATKVRGLSLIDIIKYQIGYCDSGPYSGMLIIPSYDANGFLNYFAGRSFYSTDRKHKNPQTSKDVIGFEGHINWKRPITIVEGAFDAITTKRNAIPLFGKRIMPILKARIIQEKVQDLYLALDADAYKESVEAIEYFINNGINVHYVQLDSRDPNELGYRGMVEYIGNAKLMSFFDVIRYKMNL